MSDLVEKAHLWQGKFISDAELQKRLPELASDVEAALGTKFELRFLLDACDKLSRELQNRDSANYRSLEKILELGFCMEEAERSKELKELAAFLSRADLEKKLVCELGSLDPFNFSRQDHRQNNFERWAPLGFLVHIAPTNAYAAGAWTVLEGLLSANVNFLKTGGTDEIFAQLFLKQLIDLDPTNTIAPRVFACRISSRDQASLKSVLCHADGVVVWGDESAVAGVKALSPSHARFIDWGHKISFAYFANDSFESEEDIRGLATEICRMEQQACSSPQSVYLETDDRQELGLFAKRLAAVLSEVSEAIPQKAPGPQEQAEITSVAELCRLEALSGSCDLIEDPGKKWRIFIEYSGVLKASPLYRTIWVKPLLRKNIVKTLSPFRAYLQTAGLACKLDSLSELSDLLIQAGVLRITKAGFMLDSYSGEPHDGVYALQRYAKRVSLQAGNTLSGISTFADLKEAAFTAPALEIMGKEEFQQMQVDPAYAELFFKSGGSSGEPKLSIFSYDDYHAQMKAAAYGLYAAGLDLKNDRSMNLFFAGGLYGGFISFFTILETLKAVQFPMAGINDFEMVANTIVKQNCNVLLGMPSYIIQLFAKNSQLFVENKVVEKIFYAGEHFNESQKRYFMEKYGVKLLRSCGYGSVDAGPIGFQCQHCRGAVHHLHSGLHVLEIVRDDCDQPVQDGESGRVILTSLQRAGQNISRYDIGDLARIVPGECPCGRRAQRFELLGRHGDVFRIGSAFFNYGKFVQILGEETGYAGELQIVLRPGNGKNAEELCLCVCRDAVAAFKKEKLRSLILDNYEDLKEIVVSEGLLDLKIQMLGPDEFARASGSGKLRRIVDERA